MNIDLLISKTEDVGLVTTNKFPAQVTAAIFDHESREMSLEFDEHTDSMVLNIPVTEDLANYLNNRNSMYIIGTDRVHIHEAYRIPLMHVNSFKNEGVGEWL